MNVSLYSRVYGRIGLFLKDCLPFPLVVIWPQELFKRVFPFGRRLPLDTRIIYPALEGSLEGCSTPRAKRLTVFKVPDQGKLPIRLDDAMDFLKRFDVGEPMRFGM